LKHFGPIATNRTAYVDQSPIHDVEAITSPLMVLQGLEDPGVLPSQAETLIERLDRHDKVYEYRTYERQGHGFTGEAFVDAFSRMIDFFEKYLTAPPERV
jgi:dipeptidyl aminopeptidase/acylaminoacyl peptidase